MTPFDFFNDEADFAEKNILLPSQQKYINKKIEKAPTILVDAHMDEVGFLVSNIESNGMIRVIALGGIDPKLFYGQRLSIWGKKPIEATVAAIPPHISNKSDAVTQVEDCIIDTGLKYKDVRFRKKKAK